MTSVLSRPNDLSGRIASHRHYVMCRPEHFAVTYAINPWMDPRVPVDRDRAVAQWEALRATYLDLGHRVDLIDPLPGLPDMVFAANGATVVDGVVLGARFRHAERSAEAVAHRDWFRDAGYAPVVEPEFVNEGEGDLLAVGDVVLAGAGFRTDPRAHAEAGRVLHREIVPLELVDPRYYHLDTAIAVLDAATIAWLPEAFSAASRDVLRRRFPDAVVASPGTPRYWASTPSATAGTSSCPPQHATWPPPSPTGASLPFPWTCPSCSRAVADPSAAPWRYERDDRRRSSSRGGGRQHC